ncbi:hypothetical protein A2U01_0101334, partial [Trifolium medium]|nr:hypothetical protein [Trifolium medium]
GTRANYRKVMDQMEQDQVALMVDVDSMREKMDKILELMQAMASSSQPNENNGNA